MSVDELDLVRAHEPDATGGAVVVRERGRRMGRSALPVMGLNMASLIDVVFLLMIYFMLITEFRRPEESFGLDVPQRMESGAGGDPFELPKRPVVIEVHSFGDAPGDYVLQSDEPGLGDASTYSGLFRMATEKRDRGELSSDQEFVVRAAVDARWEHALGAFNAVRRAGFTDVRFASPGL